MGDLVLIDKGLVIIETMRKARPEKVYFILIKIHHFIPRIKLPIAPCDEDDLIHIVKMEGGGEVPLTIFLYDKAGVGARRMMLENTFHASRLSEQYSSIIAVFCIKNGIV